MAKKKKSLLKKIGKAAAVAAALYGASKLGKRGYKNVHETGAITQTPGGKWGPGVGGKQHIPKTKLPFSPTDMWDNPWGAKGGGIAKRGMGAAFKKGGHVKSMGIAKRGGGVAKR